MNRQSIFLGKHTMAKTVNDILRGNSTSPSRTTLVSALETSYDDIPRPHNEQSYASFLKAFSQRIYLSYRKQFEPLNGLTRSGDPITSDCGWGCMIRCAQMLLAQTLLIHMTNTISLPHFNIQIADKCELPTEAFLARLTLHRRSTSELHRVFPKFQSNQSAPANLHRHHSTVRRLPEQQMSVRHS